MKHAEKLIARILFLEGIPIVSNLNKISIGSEVKAQLENDLKAEYEANETYNDGIRLAVETADNATRALMEEILSDENDHIDWLEAQLDQVKHMGIQNYLVEQVG
jgi:bacterioferritin